MLTKGLSLKPHPLYGINHSTSDWRQKLILSRDSPLCSTASSLTIHHVFLNSHGFRILIGREDTCLETPLGPDLNLYRCSLSSCCCFTSCFLGAEIGIFLSYSSGRCPSHKITEAAIMLALIFHQSISPWWALIGIVNSLMVRPLCWEKVLDLPKLGRVRLWKQVFHLLRNCSNQWMMGGTCPQAQEVAQWGTWASQHT